MYSLYDVQMYKEQRLFKFLLTLEELVVPQHRTQINHGFSL